MRRIKPSPWQVRMPNNTSKAPVDPARGPASNTATARALWLKRICPSQNRPIRRGQRDCTWTLELNDWRVRNSVKKPSEKAQSHQNSGEQCALWSGPYQESNQIILLLFAKRWTGRVRRPVRRHQGNTSKYGDRCNRENERNLNSSTQLHRFIDSCKGAYQLFNAGQKSVALRLGRKFNRVMLRRPRFR